MIYVFPITIPKNTPQSTPLNTTLELSPGRITQVHVQYPSGVVALAHIQIFHTGFQVFPTNPDGSFATSDETITWDDDVLLDKGVYSLLAVAWNTDASFDHTITVRIIMERLAGNGNLAAEVAELLKG